MSDYWSKSKDDNYLDWLKDEELEELLNVSEQALAMDQAIPYELREVIRVLKATVESLDDACVVMSSHHEVMLR